MNQHLILQTRLADWGYDPGPLDGVYGTRTRAALLEAWTDGADTPLADKDIDRVAQEYNLPRSRIVAIREVEANGQGFADERAKILFEPHRFSRNSGREYDASHPHLSYRKWGARKYPRTQKARYIQLLDAVGLDVDAGLMSASYGAFQILGENWKVCGYRSPFAFVMDQSRSEKDQLEAVMKFIVGNGLLGALRDGDWRKFARRYNGPAYAKHNYHGRLEAADRRA